MLVTINQ